MSTLYELTGQFQQIYDMEDLDAELWTDTLESIECEIEEKADGYAKVISAINGDIDTLDNEIKRLKAKKKTAENKVKDLKRNLEQSMELTGKKKFKTALHSFTIQKNPPSVNVLDEKEIYVGYFDEEVVRKLDKKKLLNDLKLGKEIQGAVLNQTESLRIR
ncbi:hypothetical protein COC69_05875 [Bacillus cereus]|uniref:Siphovirus Gp157 family protein n=1 Tax=Bacillus cereus TaxID=1396 RepID=A0A9X7GXA5_BACCE|nr:siphovirus Gp157 family protein [Bacillus cereus]PGS81657.1 hypothetical protein COC69_05875 [Bacillus cereus]